MEKPLLCGAREGNEKPSRDLETSDQNYPASTARTVVWPFGTSMFVCRGYCIDRGLLEKLRLPLQASSLAISLMKPYVKRLSHHAAGVHVTAVLVECQQLRLGMKVRIRNAKLCRLNINPRPKP